MPTCPLEGSAFAGRDSTTCCPSCLSVLGRDGCPQPSVRGQTHVPRSTSYPLPLPLCAPNRQPLTASTSRLRRPYLQAATQKQGTKNQEHAKRCLSPVLVSSEPRLRRMPPCPLDGHAVVLPHQLTKIKIIVHNIIKDPAMMPNHARTRPSFVGFCLISRMAKIPHQIAKGAGNSSTETKPR